MTSTRRFLLAAAAALVVLPAAAHHSGAMFDDQKSVTLVGTVREFQWTNPHSWIQLVVTAANGTVEWSVEMGAPMELYRNGWRPRTLSAGDKVTVVIHPMRDGSTAGLYVSAIAADGTPYGKRRTVASAAT